MIDPTLNGGAADAGRSAQADKLTQAERAQGAWVASLPKSAQAEGAAQGAWVASLPKSEPVAIYFDGMTNRKHNVALRFGPALEIVEDGNVVASFAYGDVRRADGPPGILRLRSVSALPLARLEISDDATKGAVAAQCPMLDGERGASRQTWRIVFWSAAAVCSIVLTAVYGIPLAADRLAPLVPFALEKRIGEAVDREVRTMFDGRACGGAEGQRAFTAMMEKLAAAGGLALSMEAEVISSAVPNAFALPGGKVYLLDGLLQKATSADEIAGVLAHELGHVQHRDSLRQIIQTSGSSFLIGLLFGDITGAGAVIFMGRSLLDASYSREAEQGADAFAVDIMRKLGRSARPMGELLVRITDRDISNGLTILGSHPLSADRLATMKKEDRPNTGPEILSAAEWRALKAICQGNSAPATRK